MPIDAATLRAWWSHRQGLDGSLAGASPSQALARSGWARSVGGVGPYLTLFSRAGTSREEADRAVAALEIHELPAARGCTYVVPADDFGLALKVGQPFGRADLATAAKLGVTATEIDKLCDAVIRALGRGRLSPDAIREAVGGASRSLGEAGKKKGLTTTLPVALGRLQTLGEIRRVPVNGRLDQQRYDYVLWRPNPLTSVALSEGEAHRELARRFFRWTGAATLAEFRGFSLLGLKASQAAVEPLGLVPIEPGSDRLSLPDDADALRRFRSPSQPQYVLVSSLDAIHAHRREVQGLLDPRDARRGSFQGKTLGGLTDLPHHAILDRGRLVGLWEYDAEAEAIVWAAFVPRDKALTEAVARTERCVREQLGDARSFSLDSVKTRAPRIAALRQLARPVAHS
jgi:hypothetical protein